LEDAEVLLELAQEESDKESENEVGHLLSSLEKKIKRFSVEITLDGEDDSRDALVSINAWMVCFNSTLILNLLKIAQNLFSGPF